MKAVGKNLQNIISIIFNLHLIPYAFNNRNRSSCIVIIYNQEQGRNYFIEKIK